MKPTKEIVRLSKKLRELGYEQKDLHRGDWMHDPNWKEYGKYYYLRMNGTDDFIEDFFVEFSHLVPIPSLEHGILWLSRRSNNVGLWGSQLSGRWNLLCTANPSTFADAPHAVVLKAMVKVLESAGKEEKDNV